MIEISWSKNFWLQLSASVIGGLVVIIGLMYISFTPTITIDEANANVEGEDYRFRIIEDRHHDKAQSYSLYMPQMVLGGQWHDMEDKWTTNKSEADDTIETELDKQQARQLPRYVIVDTVK